MKLIKVAAGVLNQTPLDWEHNERNILGEIEKARQEGASVLCLPELCITGYGCEDMFHSAGLSERAWETLTRIAAAMRGMIVSVGLPVRHENGLFNCAAMLV